MIEASAWTATVVLTVTVVLGGAFLAVVGIVVLVCAHADRTRTRTALACAVVVALGAVWLILFVGTLCCGTPR